MESRSADSLAPVSFDRSITPVPPAEGEPSLTWPIHVPVPRDGKKNVEAGDGLAWIWKWRAVSSVSLQNVQHCGLFLCERFMSFLYTGEAEVAVVCKFGGSFLRENNLENYRGLVSFCKIVKLNSLNGAEKRGGSNI